MKRALATALVMAFLGYSVTPANPPMTQCPDGFIDAAVRLKNGDWVPGCWSPEALAAAEPGVTAGYTSFHPPVMGKGESRYSTSELDWWFADFWNIEDMFFGWEGE